MIKNSYKYLILFLAFTIISTSTIWAQSQTALDIALRHVEQNQTNWNLNEQDLSDLAISDMYVDKHNGVTHIYFIQRHDGREIYNAMINIAVTKEGKAYNIGHSLIGDVQSKISTTQPTLKPEDAIAAAALVMDIELDRNHSFGKPALIAEHTYQFEGNEISARDINVQLKYQQDQNGQLQLVWDLDIDKVGKTDWYNFRINATTGKTLDKVSRVVSCQFHDNPYHNHDVHCRDEASMPALERPVAVEEGLTNLNTAMMGATYRVYELPVESPIHGSHTLVTDPHDPVASPYGWHDADGADGAEFTTTSGNNTFTFRDRQSSGSPDSVDTSGDGVFDALFEIDGGADLTFDYSLDLNGNLDDFDEAAVVNLFYMTNMMHDYAYTFGFTEAAGNFQINNYGRGGSGNDPVTARAQADFDAGAINNASFGTPGDGQAPGMQMFLWDRSGGEQKLVKVTEPASIRGTYATSSTTGWGGQITQTDSVAGRVVIINDGVPSPQVTDGCTTTMNAAEINGNIAMIDRGACEFGRKAFLAEQAGAIAVIICNFEDDLLGLGPGALGGQVSIPVVMMSSVDCALMRVFADSELEITMVEPPVVGPDFVDGDFDNGIIAHEYGHGISNRLTGGPSQAGCLGGSEQMGEGWRDFFSLVTTAKQGDSGEMRRGVGTFALRQETDGRGIRTFPYSTDMNINPDTYIDIRQRSVPHGVGSVWCQTLWDMYWLISDQEGWSADKNDATAGNNIAVQLVMDGMKLQPCNPGFVSGRDAILRADSINYNGAYTCLIWEAFARRGVGFHASEGDVGTVGDEIENFDPHPLCIPEVKIAKTVTPTIDAGDEITVTITVINHTQETAEGVIVNDEIPLFTTFMSGSETGGVTGAVNGNLVSFELGDMPTLAETTFTYKISTPADRFSVELFADPAEDPNTWFPRAIPDADGNLPSNVWALNSDAIEGNTAWNVPPFNGGTIQHLVSLDPLRISATFPVLRFSHKFNTETGQDGGLFEVTTDLNDPFDGVYSTVTDDILRNGYTGPISYAAFAIPNLPVWSGNSNGWQDTYVDLTRFNNQDVHFRFNFGTDDDDGAIYTGWSVDDMVLMDLKSYSGDACVTYTGGPNACATPDEFGTIINPQLGTPIREIDGQDVFINIFPNPADDQINLTIEGQENQNGVMSLLTIDGKEIMSQAITVDNTRQTLRMNTKDIAAGFYFVKVTVGGGSTVEKVIIR